MPYRSAAAVLSLVTHPCRQQSVCTGSAQQKTGETRDFAALSSEQHPADQQRGRRGRRRSMAVFAYIQLALFKPLDVFFRGRIRERYYSHASSALLDGSKERQSLKGRSVHSVLLDLWIRLGSFIHMLPQTAQ